MPADHWVYRVASIYKRFGTPCSIDHPAFPALAAELVQYVEGGRYGSLGDLHDAIAHVWINTLAPTRMLDTDTWRSIFAEAGPIALNRPRPTETLRVYRYATHEDAAGWSWTADPRALLTEPFRFTGLSPERVFELLAVGFPERGWFSTLIEPSQVLMTTAPSIVSLDALGLLSYWPTDEIVVDPARLGQVPIVPNADIRHLHFSSRNRPPVGLRNAPQ